MLSFSRFSRSPARQLTMLISLFITCFNDTIFPETGSAMVRLLERLGHRSISAPIRPAAARCTSTPAISARPSRWCGTLSMCFAALRWCSRRRHRASAWCAISTRSARPSWRPPALEARGRRLYSARVRAVGVSGQAARRRRCRRVLPAPRDLPHRPATRCARCMSAMRRCGCCGRCAGSTWSSCRATTSAAALAAPSRSRTPTSRWRWQRQAALHPRRRGAEVCAAGDNSCLMQIGGALSRQRTAVRAYTWPRFWRRDAGASSRRAGPDEPDR